MGTTARTYDANGNTQTGIAGMTLGYDDKNRLATAGTYTYQTNGRGERVRKAASGAQGLPKVYGYDEGGQLTGEYAANGAAQAEYVYLDNLPIAVIKSGAVSYVETDHLGTPRQVVNPATNAVVWTWDLLGNAFGTQAPTGAYALNLRFPGQYYDGETGLLYNNRRDSEPGTDRYVESDSIGLSGGISTYAYALADPLGHFDPLGSSATTADGWCGPCNDVADWSLRGLARLGGVVAMCLSLGGDTPQNCRGRIQAQGDGYEDSVPWAQRGEPTLQEGLSWLDQLAARMPAREFRKRNIALQKAAEWIRRASLAGGAPPGTSRSFYNPGQSSARIDVEVWYCNAFTP